MNKTPITSKIGNYLKLIKIKLNFPGLKLKIMSELQILSLSIILKFNSFVFHMTSVILRL